MMIFFLLMMMGNSHFAYDLSSFRPELSPPPCRLLFLPPLGPPSEPMRVSARMDRVHANVARKALRNEGPFTFDNLLENEKGLRAFNRFCKETDLSSENLLAYLDFREFTDLPEGKTRNYTAQTLVKTYLEQNTPMMLGISSHLREELIASVEQGNPSVELFDEVRETLLHWLRVDIYPRFVHSKEFRQLVSDKFESRLSVGIDHFELLGFLGAGGFGMVLLGRKKHTKRYYAIKVVDKGVAIKQNQVHTIYREKEVLAKLDHPFVVSLQYAFQTEAHLCLVIEYVPGGNMYADLMKGAYPLVKTVFYAAQVVLALEYLHSLNILYRDLKPDNVLLTGEGFLKLADMGAARGMDSTGFIDGESPSSFKTAKNERNRRMTITGTHGYRAPEVYERSYGGAADWWNLGILIIEMLTKTNPLRGENRRDSEHLAKHKQIKLPPSMQGATHSVVMGLLDRNAGSRLGSPQVVNGALETQAQAILRIKNHEFFSGIEWDLLLAGELEPPFEVRPLPAKPEVHKKSASVVGNGIDAYCEMVDYMKSARDRRMHWGVEEDDLTVFDHFDFVGSKVFEEQLDQLLGSENSPILPSPNRQRRSSTSSVSSPHRQRKSSTTSCATPTVDRRNR